ncbi:hypothetical protein KDL01_23975 [Actinospica durhamensis]|uniref:Uncharacterized protein n=1 Tax=Actinospica durhamensis TaxID=1508375 RepID=A0A941EQZ7_9ACTN|nr:hypothetical protein [Actinospica durhamensis]MBR7836357.1 hypothetical protein [Actinospica durhamensis]
MPHRYSRPRPSRRVRLSLIVAAVPLLIGAMAVAAIASPLHHGPRPIGPGHRPSRSASAGGGASAAPTGGGTAISSPANADPNCTLVVPASPLTARGLATPYRLTATNPEEGPCHEADSAQSAFVQATVYDPATGALSVYDPLVIDAGTRPAAAPVLPVLPADAVVGIWFGYDGDDLTLSSATPGTLTGAGCVNGLPGSVFTQYAYCDAVPFFTAVNRGIAAHKLTVPALGTAVDGKPCPSTRDFSIVDQDQSDNVTTQYLAAPDGRTAQDTPADTARMTGAVVLANPSDNALLDEFVDPTLGCAAWQVKDLAAGGVTTSLALDEIQAAAHQGAPAALVPLNDPMTLDGVTQSTRKTNLYRAGVDQAALPAGQRPAAYCRDMDTIQTARLKLDRARFAAAPSPDPAAADSLLTFLAGRLQGSFENLGCAGYGLTNPISSEQTDGNGVLVGFTFAGAASATPSLSPSP